MDFLDIIIMILILGAGSLFSGKKKVKKSFNGNQNKRQQPNPFEPVVETLGDDIDGDGDFRFDDNDSYEKSHNYESFKDTSSFGNDYFSYENNDRVDEPDQNIVVDKIVEQPVSDSATLVAGEGFDLRKAIVYQTIMERVC